MHLIAPEVTPLPSSSCFPGAACPASAECSGWSWIGAFHNDMFYQSELLKSSAKQHHIVPGIIIDDGCSDKPWVGGVGSRSRCSRVWQDRHTPGCRTGNPSILVSQSLTLTKRLLQRGCWCDRHHHKQCSCTENPSP